ncbi:hypothetical protein IE53DRAFT_394976 [Violaceomyces palustris]|uniref:Uncharacterized protein n=1 Tax=Violaceomyces palustris TaxID=1673888 RepID=A0ACD0NY14_9BASI|nr:hypothetical protein IE53DRAFT_394976 [Violaceomyces palustris]
MSHHQPQPAVVPKHGGSLSSQTLLKSIFEQVAAIAAPPSQSSQDHHQSSAQAATQTQDEQERGAHALNRLLVRQFLVPLSDLRADPSTVLEKLCGDPSLTWGITAEKVIDTIQNSIKSHPKALEHLFEQTSDHGDDLEKTLDFGNTTLDVWLSPRLLSFAAAQAVFSWMISDRRQSPPAGNSVGATMELLRKLCIASIEKLALVLDTSMNVTNQIQNVRLIIHESLRVSIEALSKTGQPSFPADFLLPSDLVPRQSYEATEDFDQQLINRPVDPNDQTVTFYDPERMDPQARLSFGKERPKPSGTLLGSSSEAQDHSSFSFNLCSADQDRETRSMAAQAIFLASVQLTIKTYFKSPSELADLAQLACRLLVANWTFCLESSRVKSPASFSPPVLNSWRFEIASSILARPCSPILSVDARKLASLITASLEVTLVPDPLIRFEGTTSVEYSQDGRVIATLKCLDSLKEALDLLTQNLPDRHSNSEANVALKEAQDEARMKLKPLASQILREVCEPIKEEDEGGAEGDSIESSIERARKSCCVSALIILLLRMDADKSLLTFSQLESLTEILDLESGTWDFISEAEASILSKQLLNKKGIPPSRQRKRARAADTDDPTPADKRPKQAQLVRRAHTPPRSSQDTFVDALSVKNFYSGKAGGGAVLDADGFTALPKNAGERILTLKFMMEGRLACASAGTLILDQEAKLKMGFDPKGKRPAPFQCAQCDSTDSGLHVSETFAFSFDRDQMNSIENKLFRLSTNVHVLTENLAAALDAINRSIAHIDASLVASIQDTVPARVLRHGFNHKLRGVRLAAGRLASTLARKHCQAKKSDVGKPLRQRLSSILKIHRDILAGRDARLQETAIISLGSLAKLKNEMILEESLVCLVLQLSHSNPMLKSLAYTGIVQLAAFHKCTTFQLLNPFMETVSTAVIERMGSTPDLFVEMLSLTGLKQQIFLQTTINYTLPHLIFLICTGRHVEGRKTIELIAGALGQDVPRMCLGQISSVFKYFFMRKKELRDQAFQVLLDLIGTADIKSLLRSRHHEVLGHLVVRLGDPEQRAAAYSGLEYVDQTLNGGSTPARTRAKTGRQGHLATFLKDEILAVLTWVNEELVSGHGKRSISHKVQAARSIGALVEIIGPTISMVTPQIMASLNSTLHVPELAQPTLESWKTFITTLRFDDIGPFIGQTAAAFLLAWDSLDSVERGIVKNILHYAIADNADELSKFIKDIPSLDRLEDAMPEVARKLRSLRATSGNYSYLSNILDRVANENAAICSQSLQELSVFLRDQKEYVDELVSGDRFDPLVGTCVRILFAAAARTDGPEAEIRDLCFQCLGALGAVDPDRLHLSSDEPARLLLHNFENKDESADFVVELIRDLLVPSFRATDDTKHQAALAYAIQELLKFCGFTSALLPTANPSKPVPVKVRRRWDDLPPATLDTVIPLLDSKYVVQLNEPRPRAKPVYHHSTTFRDWIQGWTNQLIIGVNGQDASTVFGVFRTVIRDQDVTIAKHVLPHLVLNVLVSGTEQQRHDIIAEFEAVLHDQVDPKTGFDQERRLLTAQTIFGLMDHLGVWMRQKRFESVRTSRRNRDPVVEESLINVESVTSCISQELMAEASLRCKAYARSLLNFEQRIRMLKSLGNRHDRDLQTYYEKMHKIYAQLDEPDGMEGISTKVISPSLEHQIREHETTGRWTAAQSCWEVELQRKPNEPDLHVGLLKCLRNLGHYDTMRTHIRGALSIHPEWEPMLASFQVEGSCILADWDEVAIAVSKPGASSAEHAIARVLLSMQRGKSSDFQEALKSARQQLGKPIAAAGKDSYARTYESVMQLHMLHELEMIGRLDDSNAAAASLVHEPSKLGRLNSSLLSRFDATLPSFKMREPLLSLRRSAFAAVTKGPTIRPEVGRSWILTSKIARRAGHYQTAYSAVLQASQCQAPFAFVQRAKLLAQNDEIQAAIQELNHSLQSMAPRRETGGDGGRDMTTTNYDEKSFARANLLQARLIEATERFKANEVIERYKECYRIDPRSEKVWYYLGHFYDQQVENASLNVIGSQISVVRFYIRSAQCGTKFFYRTLPRVLTIWLDLGDDPALISFEKSNKKGGGPPADPDLADKYETYQQVNSQIRKSIGKLAPYLFLAVFPQLVARLTHRNEQIWRTLQEIIILVLTHFPQQAMWSIVAGASSKDSERKKRLGEVLAKMKARLTSSKSDVIKIVDSSQRMAKELLRLCDFDVGKSPTLSMREDFQGLLNVARRSDLLLPLQSSMTVTLPANNLHSSNHRPFASDLPTICDFEDQIDVMNSLQKPRKIVIVGSDGKRYPFLCKPKDDLRKDARLMEFDSMINKLLQSNSESRKRSLYVRTYAVLILNEECGLIEWVPNTVGLRHILTKLYVAKGIPIYNNEIKVDMEQARTNPKSAAEIFETRVLTKFPPVFHEWFLATFPEPSAWLKARSSYARTAAVMSMVGFVLGLGDRHGENILFDAGNGDTVHVDLNCLFDKGRTFDVPERVPFRLTNNMVDALGISGVDGVFRRSAEITMGILRENKDSLMSVLEAMVHDPLVEWGPSEDSSRSKSNTNTTTNTNSSRPDPRVAKARRALDPVAQKLTGRLVYGNGPKNGGNSAVVVGNDQRFQQPLSTNNMVDSLIKDATSSTNLACMYVGWSSWL